jgi:FAD/FMN-containing dehydrogenase
VFRSLRHSLQGEVETSPFARRCYAGAAGIYARRPRAIVFPAEEADVHAVLEFCRREALPLTARGAGSGMAGNNVGHGLLLDFTRHLNRIVEFDPATGVVVAEPGVTYEGLNDFLRRHGRLLPPNPSSGRFCTLGGMVASNASGMRSVKYGPAAAWVLGVRGFWGSGDTLDVGRLPPEQESEVTRWMASQAPHPDPVLTRLEDLFRNQFPPAPPWLSGVLKNSSGLRVWEAWSGDQLNPVELLAGSEGTLGLFTLLTLRTAPLPGGRAVIVAALASLDGLEEAVGLARELEPSGVEFLDRTFLDPLRAANQAAAAALPEAAEVALFVELEGDSEAAALERARSLLERLARLTLPGARIASGPREVEALWSLRRGASSFLARLHPGRAPFQFVEDCAVPPARLSDLLRGLRTLFAEEGIPVVLFGHAGESHVHANPLLEVADPRLPFRIERIAGRVCTLIDELGGTLSGEHGDGRARAAFAERRFGRAAAFFSSVQRICDPEGVLNPGAILPEPSWTTGSDLRHPWERRLMAARARRRDYSTAHSGTAPSRPLRHVHREARAPEGHATSSDSKGRAATA